MDVIIIMIPVSHIKKLRCREITFPTFKGCVCAVPRFQALWSDFRVCNLATVHSTLWLHVQKQTNKPPPQKTALIFVHCYPIYKLSIFSYVESYLIGSIALWRNWGTPILSRFYYLCFGSHLFNLRHFMLLIIPLISCKINFSNLTLVSTS